MRARRITVAVAVTAAAGLGLAACGSSSSGGGTAPTSSATTSVAPSTAGSTTASAASSTTFKVGVLIDATGPAAAGSAPGIKGVDAYAAYLKSIGGPTLKISTVDTGSTPAGALTGAQKLIQQDHVQVIVVLSALFFAAEPAVLKAGIPAVGEGYDGSEWNVPANTNLFSYSVVDTSAVYGTEGAFMKAAGVTSCAAIGYSDNPSSAASAINGNQSCKNAGLKAGYLNQVKFSTTDTGPIVLAVKASKADGIYFPIEPQIGFQIGAGLAAQGDKMKAVLFPIGYGGDLLQSKATVAAAQGYVFESSVAPLELNTASTKLQSTWLTKQGVMGDPDLPESIGWISGAEIATGLQAAGASPTSATFSTALRKVTNFTGQGLLPVPVSFTQYSPPKSCGWFMELKGSGFVFANGDKNPVCGTVTGKSPAK